MQTTMDGALTAVDDQPNNQLPLGRDDVDDLPAIVISEESASLAHDVHCILVECHRDRGLKVLLGENVGAKSLERLAADLARRLGPRIGGRYVPKETRKGDELRAARDQAIIKRWDEGATRDQLRREFGVSRRLSYMITGAELKRRRGAK